MDISSTVRSSFSFLSRFGNLVDLLTQCFRLFLQCPLHEIHGKDDIFNKVVNIAVLWESFQQIYAFLQAGGVVNDHVVSCFRHKELIGG